MSGGACWLLAALVALPVAQGVAASIFAGAFVWPRGSTSLLRSVNGLLTGRPGRGLSVTEAAHLASTPTIYALVALFEASLTGVTAWAIACWWRHLGPGAPQGMADRAEVRTVLGTSNLRKKRPIIRPDLRRRASKNGRAQCESTDIGWHLGRSDAPRGVDVWVPYDRTAGIYGPQGSGKTLDLLTPALLATPGAALVTLTKLDDLLLTLDHRSSGDRPAAVLDPFGVAAGVPEFVWDPIAGCVDSMSAERRAKAFTAGTVKGAVAGGFGDDAARFYAAEGAKVLQAFFHAAALTGRTLDHVLEWVADPKHASEPEEILRTHPHAAPFWDGLLRGALHGDDRTAGNTSTTVQQSMALFFQQSIRARCLPSPGRPATDIEEVISRGGTIYLLGRDDPYASASPLMTAVAEDVLDSALRVATRSLHGRLCPTFLACLDELPSTAPLPTLRTRMANERALGLSFIYAAQTWRQLVICYGEDEARAMFGLTNNIVVFGGGKDGHFYREISELIGTARVARTTYSRGPSGWGKTTMGEDVPILRPEEIRQLPDRRALVVSENARPLIAKLHRCIDGARGKNLLRTQRSARDRVAASRRSNLSVTERTHEAVAAARRMALHPHGAADPATDRRGW